MDNSRYERTHYYGSVSFFLADYTPRLDECRFLILKIIEQSIRDYIALYQIESQPEYGDWITAKDFLFDDTYKINWGDQDISLLELCEIVNMDLLYLRKRVQQRFKKRHYHYGPKK